MLVQTTDTQLFAKHLIVYTSMLQYQPPQDSYILNSRGICHASMLYDMTYIAGSFHHLAC